MIVVSFQTSTNKLSYSEFKLLNYNNVTQYMINNSN